MSQVRLLNEYKAAVLAERAAWSQLLGRLPGQPLFDMRLWLDWRRSAMQSDLASRELNRCAMAVAEPAGRKG
jgi:hypothetical protein